MSAAAATPATPCPTYERRRPELSALHIVVREHLETFLATVREERGKDLPRYVVQELRRYLRCGIAAHGFLRVACRKCGQEILVSYSCKCRGACPSCSARRMWDATCHLRDHVLPDTAMRQWVLTAPFEVRRVMALRPDALTACHRFFVEELARWQKASSGLAGAETGSVTFVQRFHSALGSFVHFHVVCPDGVFTRDEEGAVRFHPGHAPSREELASVAERVEARMTRWLRRKGLLDQRPPEERSNEAPELSPLEACMQMSLFGGTFLRIGGHGGEEPDDEEHRRGSESRWAAEVRGFNIHAGVFLHKGDRDGLERLCRYGARPPFSLERISLLPDGRVAYRLRKPRRNGATHLVMTPVQFLARIAILIPPPRFPLQRFAGVLAPNSSWRRAVVAMRPPAKLPRPGDPPRPPPPAKKTKSKKKDPRADIALQGQTAVLQGQTAANTSLGAGLLTPWSGRMDWATLHRRVYLHDVLACPCGGRRTVVADIHDPDAIRDALLALGLPTEPPTLARARDPTDDAA